MAGLLIRLLRLRRGDLSRGAPLFFSLFLVIASYVVGEVARNALFLHRFHAVQLPYLDIAIAVLVAVLVAGYVRLGGRTSLGNLVTGIFASVSAMAVLFWWLAYAHNFAWVYPVIYLWIGIFGVLGPAQVWILANHVLTTREAKRLFGLVGSGAISGWIFGGLFARLLTGWVGAEALLLGIAVFMAVCAAQVKRLWKEREASLIHVEGPPPQAEAAPQNLLESARLVFRDPYLISIAAVIGLSSFATSIVGWQFKAVAEQFLVEKQAMARFFATFGLVVGIFALFTQLLLTSRVLRRYGLGVALFVAPVAVFGGSVGVLVWGTLAAAATLKGLQQVFRYSIDRSSVELLYLPIPSNIVVRVKPFLDTVVWRSGDALAGGVILLLATTWGWSASRLAWVNVVIPLGWIVAAFLARRQYVATLSESIHEHRLDAEKAAAPVLDRSTTDLLAIRLQAADPKEVLYSLSLFEAERQARAHPAVRALLKHPAAEVRRKAISLLSSADDPKAVKSIQPLIRDPDLQVRTEALLFLSRHTHLDPLSQVEELGDFPDFSLRAGMVAFLARPGETQNLETARLMLQGMVRETGEEGMRTRREAARLLAMLPDEFEEELETLLGDTDTEVLRESVRAVGELHKRQFVPRLLELVGDSQLAEEVGVALVKFGDHVVGTLRDHLNDPAVPLSVRRELPQVLVAIATPASQRVLSESLFQSDALLRFRCVAALNKLQQLHPEVRIDPQLIETALGAEIMGHYRSYQILGRLMEDSGGDDAVTLALRDAIGQELERIFRLLGLLFPRHDLHSAYVGLQSENRTVHDNALEFLDNVLKRDLRNLLVPVFDREVSVAERVEIANRLVGTRVESRQEAVLALLASDDPWLKSCGAYAVGTLGLKSLERELDGCLQHPDALLRETVRWAKLRLAEAEGGGGSSGAGE